MRLEAALASRKEREQRSLILKHYENTLDYLRRGERMDDLEVSMHANRIGLPNRTWSLEMPDIRRSSVFTARIRRRLSSVHLPEMRKKIPSIQRAIKLMAH